jgi:PAB-dependent poly(A)-specific ribonuclease subunit 3
MVVLKKIGGGTTDIRIHQRVLRKWQWTRHPNIIPLNNFTVTSALSVNHTDECIAEYKYVADLAPVETIKDVVPEALVWSIAVQLASAIRHVHYCGTALRCINPSMVCLGSWGRVYITSVGSAEISQRDTQPLPPTEQQQARDLEDLGQLLLSICACYQVGSSVETLLASPHYTLGLKHFVVALLPSNPTRARGITRAAALWDMLGERVSEELSTLTGNLNSVLQQQMQHMHSSRALRVLIKLGFVLDRPEYEKDLRWGESGDRYILKLFRSYVFHQNDDSGVILDWGHVACCLHKLDVGSEEKLLLLSKDDTSVVVTSFQEMRHLMEAVFLELQDASRSRATIPQQR